MSVKEVLQSLVDDNMVDCERVGTSNYYWAFPSKALHARKRRLEELDKQHTEAKQRKMSLQQAVDKAKVGREDTEERASLLKELQALREKRSHLKSKLEKNRECDPEVIEEMSVAYQDADVNSRTTTQVTPCAGDKKRLLLKCGSLSQHNATDISSFEGACNWHADCRNVHQSCCQIIFVNFSTLSHLQRCLREFGSTSNWPHSRKQLVTTPAQGLHMRLLHLGDRLGPATRIADETVGLHNRRISA
ncbi:meiotic nuclear division protein 1 homolog isoform X2 [Oncorhynchus keta]|nr:meiotic nuclear division protein 1 homolog isoform X2 [Oncorhynchus keta]XP_052320357.1 meiotic nuclear division protein 1 homolog isoform X2 [Oncorhynchus keta]